MRKLSSILMLGGCLIAAGGCQRKPQTDYTGLDTAGMWSTNLDELKKLHASDAEIAQLTRLKQAGASDDLCLSLLKAARAHHHEFTSGESAISLSRAGYTDPEILEMAQTDQIDMLATDAIMLKLLGLSNGTVQTIMHRRVQKLPTPTSAQIGRLKNTGMSEKQILEFVDQGYSDALIEAFITQREATRNHANTGFVRVQGRRRR